MTLFLVAIAHAVVVVVFVVLSIRISKNWERIENYDFKHWKKAKQQKIVLSDRLSRTSCLGRLFCGCSDSLEYARLLELVRFHELKWRFLRNNHLPPHFHFTIYLRKAKQHIFRELGSLPSGMWAALCAVVLVDLILRSDFDAYDSAVTVEVVMPLVSVLIVAGCITLFTKIRSVYWAIMHSQVIEIDADLALSAKSWTGLESRLAGDTAMGDGTVVVRSDPSVTEAVAAPRPPPHRIQAVRAGSALGTPSLPGAPDAPRRSLGGIQPGDKRSALHATMPAFTSEDIVAAVRRGSQPHLLNAHQRSSTAHPAQADPAAAGPSELHRRRGSARHRSTLVGGRVLAPRSTSFVGPGLGAHASAASVGGGSDAGSAGAPSGTVRTLRRGLAWMPQLSELGPLAPVPASSRPPPPPANPAAPPSAGRGSAVVGGAAGEGGSIRHTVSRNVPSAIVSTGCCGCYAICAGHHSAGERFHQRDLFWFRNPTLIVFVMRLLVFAASVLLAMFVQFIPQWGTTADRGSLAAVIASVVMMLLGLGFFLQRIVPLYVLTTHIGELVDEKILLVALQKSDARHAVKAARKIHRADRRKRHADRRAARRAARHAPTLRASTGEAGIAAGLGIGPDSAAARAAASDAGSSVADPRERRWSSQITRAASGEGVAGTLSRISEGDPARSGGVIDPSAPPSEADTDAIMHSPLPETAAAITTGAPEEPCPQPPSPEKRTDSVVTARTGARAAVTAAVHKQVAHLRGETAPPSLAPIRAAASPSPSNRANLVEPPALPLGGGRVGPLRVAGGVSNLPTIHSERAADAAASAESQPAFGDSAHVGSGLAPDGHAVAPTSFSLAGCASAAPSGRSSHFLPSKARGDTVLASEPGKGLFPVASAFWGAADAGWAPGQARAVLNGGEGQHFADSHHPPTQSMQLSREEWSALLAGLPIEEALKLPSQARHALLEAFADDLSSSSSSSSDDDQDVDDGGGGDDDNDDNGDGHAERAPSHQGGAAIPRRGHRGQGRRNPRPAAQAAIVEVRNPDSLRLPVAADLTGAERDAPVTAGRTGSGGGTAGGSTSGSAARRAATTKQLSRKLSYRVRRCQCDCGALSECGDWCSFACLPVLFGEDAEDTESDSDSDVDVEEVTEMEEVNAGSPGAGLPTTTRRSQRPKRYRPTGLAGCMARLGDLLSRARRWRAAVVLLIALGSVSSVLIAERNVSDEVGLVVVTIGEMIALIVGIVMSIEFVLRLIGSVSYICTGRAVVLVSPTPDDIATRMALAAELNDETDSGPVLGESVTTTAVLAAAETETTWAMLGRGLWRTLDAAILLASAALLLVSSTAGAGGKSYHEWSAVVALRFIFVVPWRKILRGDPTSSDGHDHSDDLALRRRLHARIPHHHSRRHHSRHHGSQQQQPEQGHQPHLHHHHHHSHHRHKHHGHSHHHKSALGLAFAGGSDAGTATGAGGVASVLASRGEFTFYTDDRDYTHGYSTAQLQVRAIANRLKSGGSQHGSVLDDDAATEAGANGPSVPSTPGGMALGSADLVASTMGAGEGRVRSTEAPDSSLSAALAAEMELVSSNRSGRRTVMMLPPEEIAAALEDVTATTSEVPEAAEAEASADDSDSDSDVVSDSSND